MGLAAASQAWFGQAELCLTVLHGVPFLERIDDLFSLEKHHQIGIIASDAGGRHIVTALRDGFRAVLGDHEGC